MLRVSILIVDMLVVLAAAIQCLKRKKLYEVQVEQLGNFQLRIHDQVLHRVQITSSDFVLLEKLLT